MELVAVAAVADNGVIGADGDLPWSSIPADRAQYRARVAEHPVILGRRTFESMLGDLPGSQQIVLTSDTSREYDVPTAHLVGSADEAIECAKAMDAQCTYVLGGGVTFNATFDALDRLVISRVPGTYPGDTEFPAIDSDNWKRIEASERSGFTLETWVRREGYSGEQAI